MLQLKKSVRVERLQLPLKRALQVASRLGAEAVELNARTEIHPKDMSRTAVRHLLKILGDLNLKVSALHYPTRRGYQISDDLEPRIQGTQRALSLAYELGCSVVVNDIGRIPDPTDDCWTTLIQALSDIGHHSQKAGAFLAASTGFVDGASLEDLLKALPPMAIGIDFDPGDLLIHGHSPSESIKSIGEHVLSFRAKDAVRDIAVGRGVEVQLGRGAVDWPTLFSVLEENHYQGYVAVDRQFSDNFEVECSQSLEYLERIFD